MPRLNVNRTRQVQAIGPGIRSVSHETEAAFAYDDARRTGDWRADRTGWSDLAARRGGRHRVAASRLRRAAA